MDTRFMQRMLVLPFIVLLVAAFAAFAPAPAWADGGMPASDAGADAVEVDGAEDSSCQGDVEGGSPEAGVSASDRGEAAAESEGLPNGDAPGDPDVPDSAANDEEPDATGVNAGDADNAGNVAGAAEPVEVDGVSDDATAEMPGSVPDVETPAEQAAPAVSPAKPAASAKPATTTEPTPAAEQAPASAPAVQAAPKKPAATTTSTQKPATQKTTAPKAATTKTATTKTATKQAVTTQATAPKAAAKAASASKLYTQATGAKKKTAADATLSYRAHVQSYGWLKAVGSGDLSGTSGEGKRLEALTLKIAGFPYSGSIKYQTHVQGIGWQKAVADGKVSGTSGESRRIEALKIWLTGDLAKHYDVVYRGHVQSLGWRPWVKNGSAAGSTGRSLRLEAIEVVLTPKTVEAATGNASKVGVRADAHVQGIGWQPWVGDGAQVGTSGQSRRVEGMNIVVSTGDNKGGVRYKAHVQGIGWQDWVADGKMMGTSGQSRRIEALCVELTGAMKDKYDIYYCAHVQNRGWSGWAKNGQKAGSTGLSYRCEAIKVKLVKKGAPAPGPTGNRLFTAPAKKRLDGIDISSWQPDIVIPKVDADFVIVKSTEGTWYTNPYFYEHADQVLKSGKLLGSYHFANEGNATEQADFFVKAVGPYLGKCALFLDWENTNYSDTMSQGPAWAKKFMDRVYAKTGVKPLIYTSANVTRSYDWSTVAKSYGLWLAQYPDYNETGYLEKPWVDDYGTGAWSSHVMHQYTSSGVITGYDGHLDLNKFYGTVNDWKKIAAKQ